MEEASTTNTLQLCNNRKEGGHWRNIHCFSCEVTPIRKFPVFSYGTLGQRKRLCKCSGQKLTKWLATLRFWFHDQQLALKALSSVDTYAVMSLNQSESSKRGVVPNQMAHPTPQAATSSMGGPSGTAQQNSLCWWQCPASVLLWQPTRHLRPLTIAMWQVQQETEFFILLNCN